MATDKSREVRLGVEIETTGEESVRRLADDVRRLAKEGSNAAPEFTRLATELDRFADQGGALASVRLLTEEIAKLAAEQTEAAAKTEAVGAKYTEAKTKADALRAEQARLAAAVRETNLEVVKAKGDIDTYAAGFNKAGKDTAEFVARQGQLTRVLADAKTALAGQKAELAAITPAIRAATSEETKLAAQFEATAAKARATDDALRRRNAALDESAAAARAAGISTDDLVAADTALLASIQEVTNATTRLAQAEREAAASGLAAARREQAEFDEQAANAAYRLAEARKAATLQAQSELAAIRESEQFIARYEKSLRETAAATEALAAADGVAAMRALEQAAREADVEFDKLTQSLRATEAAAEQFAAATARAAGASADDVAATQARRRAADALLQSEQALNIGQRELAATRDAGRAALLAEAQALTAAARQADEYRAASERLVAASRRAGESIEAAFGATGIRSINAIETEIRQTEVAMESLAAAARKGALGTNELERAAGAAAVKINRLQAEILQVQALPGTFERLGDSVNGLVTKFGALSAVIATVGFAALPVVRSFIALESATRILTSVTGSATVAAQQIEFLRNTAQRSGQAFDDLSKSYAKFAASALQTGLSLTDTQQVFDSVALAAGNLGLSSDQVGRALEALSQIASKGVVSMEELRGQLGDALPGVLPLLARELGLTTQELNKVVESGGLLAFEAIPAIGRALTALGTEGGKPVQGLVAEFNRLKNAVFETTNNLAEGAVGRAVGAVFTAASTSVKGLLALVDILGTGITSVGDKIGVIAGSLAALDFSRVNEEFARIDAGAAAANAKTISRLQEIGAAATTAAGGATTLGESVKTATLALDAGATATDAQVKSLAQLSLANQKSVDATEALARSAEKLVQAKKDENEALIRTVALAGDELATRRASATAAEDLARTTDALAAADRAVVDALRAARAATIEYATANGTNADAIKASTEAIDKSIASKEADAEKSKQQAAASRAAAAAAKLAAAAVEDNAGQYEALAQEVDDARTALDAVVRAFGRDKAGADEVREATERLALAKGKLKDASDDQVSASKRVVDALKAEAEFTKAQIELELTRLRIMRDEAVARGQTTTAAQLGNTIRDLELKSTVTGTKAKRDEANEIIRSTALMLAQGEQQGTLTESRRQELNTIIKQQQAIVLQTDAADANEKQQQKNNDTVRTGTTDRERNTERVGNHTQSLGGNTSGLRENTRELDKNTRSFQQNGRTALEVTAAQKAAGVERINAQGLAVGSTGGIVPFGDNPGAAIPYGGGTANNNLGVDRISGQGGTSQAPVPSNGPWEFTLDPQQIVTSSGYDKYGQKYPGGWKRPDGYVSPAVSRNSSGGFNPFFGQSNAGTPRDTSSAPADTVDVNANTAASFERNGLNPRTGRPYPAMTAEQMYGRTVTVNLVVGGQTIPVTTSEASADQLVRSLEDAQRRFGG